MLVGNVINKKINRINVRISRNKSRNRNINRINIYTRLNKIRNRKKVKFKKIINLKNTNH